MVIDIPMSVLANVEAPFRAVEAARPREESPHGPRPDGWRDRRRMLDACLSALEDESERGHRYVSSDLAALVRRAMPGIRTGDLIRESIELVFQEQERTCRVLQASLITPVVKESETLRRDEARALTEQIKAGLHATPLLLLEAHSKRAWQVLGYSTWEEYVRREFNFSRSRSYQLLDHGRVLRVLMASAKLTTVPDISAYAAAQILPRLDEVAAAVARRVTPDMDERAVRQSIHAVVESYRAPIPRGRETVALTVLADVPEGPVSAAVQPTAPQTSSDVAALKAIIEQSLRLPDAEDVFRWVDDDDFPQLSKLRDAAARLTAFADAWARHAQAKHVRSPLDSERVRVQNF